MIILITGAGDGIGKILAFTLAEDKKHVYAVAQNEIKLLETDNKQFSEKTWNIYDTKHHPYWTQGTTISKLG